MLLRLQKLGKALGSEVALTIVVKNEAEAKPIFQALWASITAFEARFSRFLPDSELSHFNALAGQAVTISPALQKLLETARDYSLSTNGLYNPFILPALQRAGYIGSWPEPTKYHEQLDYSNRRQAVAEDLVINAETARIPANSAIDFGGIGKGYLLDQLADYLDAHGVHNYWLSLGGDIVSSGYDHQGENWKIGVADALEEDKIFDAITNQDGQRKAIATSGVTIRKGADWHHIIDPRTGQPAETDVLTATLTADSATAADVYAKCLIILGSASAEAFVKAKKSYAIVQTLAHCGAQALHYGKRL